LKKAIFMQWIAASFAPQDIADAGKAMAMDKCVRHAGSPEQHDQAVG
jgi:hypothetical protein